MNVLTPAEFEQHVADPWWRMCNLYWIVDKDKRTVPFVPNQEQTHLFHNLHNRNAVLKARQLGFCLDPNTRVLTADLRWLRIADVQPGQELVAVDEHVPGGKGRTRKMRAATVVASAVTQGMAYRMTFDDGRSVVCSGEHRWLTRRSRTMKQADWRSIKGEGKKRISVGTLVRWITKPWGPGDIEDGWFGGMLDGEGSIAKTNSSAGINVCQRTGPVWDRLVQYAHSRGYNACIEADIAERPNKHGKVPVPRLAFGRMDEMLRLIGQTRPTRFIANRFWLDRDPPGKKSGEGWATVVSIEQVGEMELIDLQTTTGTFIAEGFVSHNSTFMQLLALDQCLFNRDFEANVIADTLPNAIKLFRKAAFAYDKLPGFIQAAYPLKSRSKSEFIFKNGSVFSTGTSARGGTPLLLHVSEMGKIGRKYPEKAREIVTGAFEAVPRDGIIVVESTAEGNGGEFFDLCDSGRKKKEAGETLTELDFKLHFFPWFYRDEYRLEVDATHITPADEKYFRSVEATCGVKLDTQQRVWYLKKREVLKRDMKREYPATIKEAFEQAIEGAVYGDEMTLLRERGRICPVPIDPFEPVNTFWDLGSNDFTAIWLHQRIGAWDHFIGYMHGSHKGLRAWWRELEDFRAEHGIERWGRHYLPHDGDAERQGEEVESARSILEDKLHVKNVEIVTRTSDRSVAIDLTREAMVRSVRIDEVRCIEGIRCLDSYQYEWDEKRGQWKNEPLHNWASNGADAFRQWAQGFRPGADISESISKFKNRPRRGY